MQRKIFLIALMAMIMFNLASLSAGTQAINRDVFVGVQTEQSFGTSIACGDFNGDDYSDLLVSAPQEATTATYAGKLYLYFGGPQSDRNVDMTIQGTEEYEYLGSSVSSAGDFNGDGFEDFIVGAYGFNNNKGVAFIYFGGPYLDIYPDVRLEYSSASTFGDHVTKLGDVNGDGFDDVAVSDANNVFVYFGNSEKSADNYQIISGYGTIPAYGGDINGDGLEDILVGHNSGSGQVSVFLGSTSWHTTPDIYMYGLYSNERFASSLTGGMDVNGDGYSDVVVGAPDNGNNGNYAGAVYLYFGGPAMVNSNHTFGYSPSVTFYGDTANVHLGYRVGFSKDIDGDGFAEILAAESVPWYSSKSSRVFVFKGDRQIKTSPFRILHGEENKNGTYFGAALASGDFNTDGYPEIFVGANGLNKVFMFRNNPTGTETIADLVIDAQGSNYQDANGDVNGDGYDDIILGGGDWGSYPLSVFYGGPNMDGNADVVMDGSSYPSTVIHYVGDVNGDGLDDIVGTDDGLQAVLYYGSKGSTLSTLELSGANAGDYERVNSGDFNNDGFSDFVIRVHESTIDTLLVYYGGGGILGYPDLKIGEAGYGGVYFNNRPACLDIDGDGYDDLLYIFWNDDDSQLQLKIYLGSADGLYYFKRIQPQDLGIEAEEVNAVKTAGDINHDGFDDFLLELDSDDSYSGSLLFYGNMQISDFENTRIPNSHLMPPFYGYAGDISGDGIDDLLLVDHSSGSYRVAVYAGGKLNWNAPFQYYQQPQTEKFGYTAQTGDFNGDGIKDMAIFDARSYEHASTKFQKMYIYFSSPTNSAPRLTAVSDVPADQGGKVTLVWFKSAYDGGLVHNYRIERSIAPAGNGFAWETITTVSARQNNYYSCTARTLSDAIEGYNGNTYFRVTALDGEDQMVSQSNIAYGHSVDNLAPAAVSNVSGSSVNGQVQLSWKANSESDLKEYHIYRSVAQDVNPDTLELYAAVTDTVFEDNAVPDQDKYYFVRAVDVHGNSGPAGQWVYSATGLAANETLPETFALEQNYPNPFNPTTSISYQIAKQGNVLLIVYNALGQRVATLVNQKQAPGRYKVTFDANGLTSGVYFYRLQAGGSTQVRKMLLVR